MKLLRTPLESAGRKRLGAAFAVVLVSAAGIALVHEMIRGHGGGLAFAQDLHCAGSAGVSSRTRTVSSVPEFFEALKASKSGDKIMLSPGGYAQIVIRNVCFDPAVTIASADPAHPAVIQGLKVAKSAGLTFSDLEATPIGSGDNYAGIRLQQSKNMTFSHLDAHGDTSAEPGTQLQGIYALDIDGLTVEQSDFHHLRAGLVLSRDNDVSVVGTRFHDVSKGGVEAVATSQMKLQNNSFYDFSTAPGVHGDGIQIFTSGQNINSHDILISGNLVIRGNGTPKQGIFVQDEQKTLPFHNVTIEDNAVIGEQWNSVYLSHATGDVRIRDNVMATWTGANVVRGGNTDFRAFLRMGDFSGASVVVTGNQAQDFLVGVPAKKAPPPPGNVKLGPINDRGAALTRKWLAAHGATRATLPAALTQELGIAPSGASTAAQATRGD